MINSDNLIADLENSYLKEFLEQENDNNFFRGAGYSFLAEEILGEIIDINFQYLRKCPPMLLISICSEVTKEMMRKCKEMPTECGWCENNKVYNPVKFTEQVIITIKLVCKHFLDNSNNKLGSIIPKIPPQIVSVCSIKNKRRTMEDRHFICNDFNMLFNLQDLEPTSFYGIFDGHAGKDAANYAAAHLHHNLASNSKYPKIDIALQEAFLKTDLDFIEKSQRENLHSGTTAVCALLRHSENKLWVGWVGDSQAVLVKNGKLCQIVRPHTCESQSERQRISKAGGNVLSWNGQYRVNGQLLISRAIGDVNFKPYVSAEPEIECIPLDGNEDFLILACDGLWDYVNPDDCAISIYKFLESSVDIDRVAKQLVDLAVDHNSADNITVIVIFLKPLNLIKKDWFGIGYKTNMDPVFEENSTFVTDFANQESKTAEELENEINLQSAVLTTNKLSLVSDESHNLVETDFLKLEEDTKDKDNDLFNVPIIAENNNCEKTEKTADDHDLPTNDGIENKILEEFSIENADIERDFETEKKAMSEAVEHGDLDKDANKQEQIYEKLDSTEKCDTTFEKEPPLKNDYIVLQTENKDEKMSCDQNETSGEVATLVDSGAEESEDEWDYIKGKISNNQYLEESNIVAQSTNNFENLMDNVQENIEKHIINENLSAVVNELKVDCDAELDDNMASQLNPDAKEFVPLSPQRSTPTNPFAPNLHLIDDVIAQSPRKGTLMDDIPIPSENEFENEISKRPHELETNVDDLVLVDDSANRPGSSTSNNENGTCVYQELNLKEAMQGDEKLEGEYNDETDKMLENNKELMDVECEIMEKPFKNEDPMNKSFYEGRDSDLLLTSGDDKNDELNKVQILPNNEEVEENSCDDSETNKENINSLESSGIALNVSNGHHVDTGNQPELLESQNANPCSSTMYSAAQELTENFSNLLIDINGAQETKTLSEKRESDTTEVISLESEEKLFSESPKPPVNEDSINHEVILSENSLKLISDLAPLKTETKDISVSQDDVPAKVEEIKEAKPIIESVKKPMKITSTTVKQKPSESKKSDIKVGTVGAAKSTSVKKTSSMTSNKPSIKSTIAAKPIAPRVPATRSVSANVTKSNSTITKSTATPATSADAKKITPVKSAPITRKTPSLVQAKSTVPKSAPGLTKSNTSKTDAVESSIKSTVPKQAPKLSSTVPLVPKVSRVSPTKPRPTSAVLKSTSTGVTDVKPKVATTLRSSLATSKIKDAKTTGTSTLAKTMTTTSTKSSSYVAKKPLAATRVSKTPAASETVKNGQVVKKNNESKEISNQMTPNGTNKNNLTADLNNETTACTSNGNTHLDTLIPMDTVKASD